MSIIIDLAVILIIALFTFIGYKQGLVKALIKIASFFIAIIIAMILYKPISNFVINNSTIDDNIKNTIVSKINPVNSPDKINIEDGVMEKIVGSTSSTAEEIANAMTIKLIQFSVLVLLFILIKIALMIIIAITDLITKLPGLKQINKLGGTIYGLIKGVVIVYIILAIMYLVSPLIKNNTTDLVDKTIITKELYDHNLVLNLVV